MADPSALSERRRQSYLALCSPEELARHARIRHAETRDHHLLTRALVRTSLSRYSERAPEAWRFVENDHGCPFIEPSQNAQGLQFNVSHTTGLILCALTQRRAIGVDVEYEPRKSRITQIADRFFAPPEVEALERLPDARHRERFFTYWTLKESYIKARGMGLAIPLSAFWFDVDRPGEIHFETAPSLEDPAEQWAFRRLRSGSDHPIALAIAAPKESDIALRTFRVEPLGGHEEVRMEILARSL